MITIKINTDAHPYNGSNRGSAISDILKSIADEFLNEYYNGEPVKPHPITRKDAINPVGTIEID